MRIGPSFRALRIRRGQRQEDVAAAAGLARATVSRVECGEVASCTVSAIDRLCQALGADLDIRVRWHGEGLDRLLDEAHAGIVNRFLRLLRERGWETAVEVTFNEYGDRGSIDVLGWFPSTRSLLIAEIKSVVADAQGTLAPLDRKERLGAKIGRGRGWDAATVSTVLVVRDGSTNRRRVDALGATFGAAFPVRGVAFRSWLRAPAGSVRALLFLPDNRQKSTGRTPTGRERVTRPRARAIRSQ